MIFLKQSFLLWLLATIFFLTYATFAVAAICGNGSCEMGESECNCQADCGFCGGDVKGLICKSYTCLTGRCEPTLKFICCGNGICEANEAEEGCVADCKARTLAVQVLEPKPNSTFPRGFEIPVKARARTEYAAALDATATASAKFFGSVVLYDDGQHGDDASRDGIYANKIGVSSKAEKGTYDLNVSVVLPELTAIEKLPITIDPKLDISASTDREAYALGELITFSGRILRGPNPSDNEITLDVYIDDNSLLQDTIKPDPDGKFVYDYHSSLIDPPGNYVFKFFAKDAYGNAGLLEKNLSISKTAILKQFDVKFLSPLEGIFKRGQNLQVIVEVSGKGESLEGVNVIATMPDSKEALLAKISETRYAGILPVGISTNLGIQKILATAQKIIRNVRLSGTSEVKILIEKADIQLDLTRPAKETFMLGETILFEFMPRYENGKLVETARLNLTINGQNVPVRQLRPGLYAADYMILDEASGKLYIELNASDNYKNTGKKQMTFTVQGMTLDYLILRKQGFVILSVVIFLILFFKFVPPLAKSSLLNHFDRKKQNTEKLITDLQKAYYKRGEIPVADYNRLFDSYSTRLEQIDKQKKLLEKFYASYEAFIGKFQSAKTKQNNSKKSQP